MNAPSSAGLGIQRLVGWAVLLVMVAALAYASVSGDFWREGAALATMPWGQVTLIEAYIGFVLIGAWILHREPRTWHGVLWIVALCALGHVVSGIYVLRAAAGAGKDRDEFWNGAR